MILAIVFYIWMFSILLVAVLMWRTIVINNRRWNNIIDIMTSTMLRNTAAVEQLIESKERLIDIIEMLRPKMQKAGIEEGKATSHDT